MGLFDYLAPADSDQPAPAGGPRAGALRPGTRVGLVMGVKAGSDLPPSRL